MKKYEVIKLLEKHNDNDNIDFSSLGDSKDLEMLISMGYISKTKHSSLPLYIYNYTPKTQYDKKWNDLTISHRGLIKDEQGNIIARSFNKIFNYSELSGARLKSIKTHEKFNVIEKLDGSLLIVFFYGGTRHTATRGSFHSEQAIKGKSMIDISLLDSDYTYLFEIIYPENRIVLNYDGERLVFLGKTDKEGNIYRDSNFNDTYKEYGEMTIKELLELREQGGDNIEGYVCYNGNDMFKIKTDEYVELHKLKDEYTKEGFFELIKQGQRDFSAMPDEFHQEIREMIEFYEKEYYRIRDYCKERMKSYQGDRKEILNEEYRGVMFAWLDFKDISPAINVLISLPKDE